MNKTIGASYKIEEHKAEKGVTKCADSTRNNNQRLSKSKEAYLDRKYHRIKSPYDDLQIISNGLTYRLEQVSNARAKRNGYSFKAHPLTAKGLTFLIMETQLKIKITKGVIKVSNEA